MFGKKYENCVPLEHYQITDLLPHREPFLFVDRIVDASAKQIIAERTFNPDTWFFKGHFPSYPIVPGVILIETLAQCGGAGLVSAGIVPQGNLFLLAAIYKAMFRRQVRPGELVRMEIDVKKCTPRLLKQSGKGFVNGELAVEAEWMCMIKSSQEGVES